MLRSLGLALLLALGLGLGLTAGCNDDDDIGKPCEDESDCSEDLECDFHDGQGTCQVPHDD